MNTSNITNYKPKDFAELLGVSVKILYRWDREETLKANRTLTLTNKYLLNQVAFLRRFCNVQKRNSCRAVYWRIWKLCNDLLDEVMKLKSKA